MTTTARERLDETFSDVQEVPIPDRKTRKTTQSRQKTHKPLPAWREGMIAAWASNAYVMAGSMIEPFDEALGKALVVIASPAGRTWEKWAKQNIVIRRWFAWLMETSVAGEMLMVHMPVFMAVIMRINPMRTSVQEMASEFQSKFRETLQDEAA